jgi:meso-butanediol dehydrogenase / (S,S)-butanediol dehydrogenase / diacetyl reductase
MSGQHSMSMQGHVSIVTGGASGIGLAVVEALTARGGHGVIAGPPGPALDAAATRTGAATVEGDASHQSVALTALVAAQDRWGRLDSVICCAGVAASGNIGHCSGDEWDRVLNANLRSAVTVVRACLPALLASRGTIVLVSSLAGVLAVPDAAPYVVSKHALIGLARSLASDLGPLGVRANAVCPGATRTAMLDGVMAEAAARRGITQEEAYRRAAALIPRRQAATPAEIAEVILFLAGPASAAVNGAVIMADGGVSSVDLSMAGLGPAGEERAGT